MGRFQDAKIERKCIDCGVTYLALSPAQKRCGGTKKVHEGCSWKKHLKRKAISNQKWSKKKRQENKIKREIEKLKQLQAKYTNV
jgi:hypothetical protein